MGPHAREHPRQRTAPQRRRRHAPTPPDDPVDRDRAGGHGAAGVQPVLVDLEQQRRSPTAEFQTAVQEREDRPEHGREDLRQLRLGRDPPRRRVRRALHGEAVHERVRSTSRPWTSSRQHSIAYEFDTPNPWIGLLYSVLPTRAADRTRRTGSCSAGWARGGVEPAEHGQEQGQDLRPQGDEDHLLRRGRRRRGEGGAPRDRRVPAEPEEVPAARRPHPEGCAAARPARVRQDAARPGRRRRGERAVLLHERLGVRRDVRRPRRRPCPRAVPAGEGEGPGAGLPRRDRHDRQGPLRHDGSRVRRARRARADPEPAPGRDGRLRRVQGRHHHGRHEPPRRARPGARAAGPLRPPGRRGPARPARPRGDPAGARARRRARPRRRPPQRSRRGRRGSPAPTSRTS